MKTKMSVLIGGLLVALLVVGLIGATNAYAQDQSSTLFHGRGPGGDGRGLRPGTPEFEAAAEALNMTTDELTTALQGGKTLEQIATDAGVEYADVQAAIREAHETEMRERIQQAVDDGTITQENADWLLEGLDKGFIGVPGLGGPHGLRPDKTPSTQPTPASES